jgi:hypothetical protein
MCGEFQNRCTTNQTQQTMKNVVKHSLLAIALFSLAGTSFADSVSPRTAPGSETRTVALFANGNAAGSACSKCTHQQRADLQTSYRETGHGQSIVLLTR